MVTAVVKQLKNGVVVECTASDLCMKCNSIIIQTSILMNGCTKKECLLSVANHGDRCAAYDVEHETWLIDEDVAKIKQLK